MNSLLERHILFGVIALLRGIVKPEQLTALLAQWKEEQSQPFGEFLVRTLQLPSDLANTLSADVERCLSEHHNDPQLCIDAIHKAMNLPLEHSPFVDIEHYATMVSVRMQEGTLANEAGSSSLSPAHSLDAKKRFILLRDHAQGGLGKVSVALDSELNRQVAVKEIRPDRANDYESQIRFVHEAEITGQLEHPGIVPVYGIGSYEDGRPFYAMRFVEGENLKTALQAFHKGRSIGEVLKGERAVAFRGLLGRFVAVCQAIEYAHSRKVIHRDLKPENILLGPYGETLVVDWGLAKSLASCEPSKSFGLQPSPQLETTDSDPMQISSGSRPVQLLGTGSAETLDGSTIGTPAFMSPEQASGKVSDLGPATDIYSLGATLFVLLTGKPPISGKHYNEILSKTRHGDIDRVTDSWASAPGALIAICERAMALRPSDRYSSAIQLAKDIEKWLADEPIAVYREPAHEQISRFIRKKQAIVATSVVLLLASLSLLAVSTWFRSQLSMAERATEIKNIEIKSARQHAREQELFARINGVRERSAKRTSGWSWLNADDLQDTSFDFKNPSLERLLREESARLVTTPDFRKTGTLLTSFRVSEICWSPDGKWIALGQNTATFGQVQVRLFDAETLQPVKSLSFFLSVADTILKGETDGVTSLIFSPNSRSLFVGTRRGEIHQYDMETLRDVARWQAHSNYVDDLCMDDEGAILISASRDNTIKWWSLSDKAVLNLVELPGNRTAIRLRNELLALSNGPHLYPLDPKQPNVPSKTKFDLASGKVIQSQSFGILVGKGDQLTHYNEHGTMVRQFHSNVALGSIDNLSIGNFGKSVCLDDGAECDVWDFVSGAKMGSIHGEEITDCSIDPMRPRFLVADNGRLDCYEIREDPGWKTLPVQPSVIDRMVLSADGTKAFTTAWSEESVPNGVEIRRWDLSTFQEDGVARVQSSDAKLIAVDPTGTHIAFVNFPKKQLTEMEWESKQERVLYSEKLTGKNLAYTMNGKELWLTALMEAEGDAARTRLNTWQLMGIVPGSNSPFFQWGDQVKQAHRKYSHFTDVAHGKQFRVAAFKDSIVIWPQKGSDFKRVIFEPELIERLTLLDEDRLTVAGLGSGKISVLNNVTSDIILTKELQAGRISAIAAVGKRILLIGDASGEIAIWHWNDKDLHLVARLGPFGNGIESILPFGSDRRVAVHIRQETAFRILDLERLIQGWRDQQLFHADDFPL